MRRTAAAVTVGAGALLGGLAATPAGADVPMGPQQTRAGPWQVTNDGMGTPLGEVELPTAERQVPPLPMLPVTL